MSQKSAVRIEVVVNASTVSEHIQKIGKLVGNELLMTFGPVPESKEKPREEVPGRPFAKLVLTFEDEMTHEELRDLARTQRMSVVCKEIKKKHGIDIHSIRVSRNFQH